MAALALLPVPAPSLLPVAALALLQVSGQHCWQPEQLRRLLAVHLHLHRLLAVFLQLLDCAAPGAAAAVPQQMAALRCCWRCRHLSCPLPERHRQQAMV